MRQCAAPRADPREGGGFRVSLTYDDPMAVGKSSARTDTYHGQFLSLVPDRQVVELVELETPDPELRGPMTVTTTLQEVPGGTAVLIEFEGLPSGISEEDNRTCTLMALTSLVALVKGR